MPRENVSPINQSRTAVATTRHTTPARIRVLPALSRRAIIVSQDTTRAVGLLSLQDRTGRLGERLYSEDDPQILSGFGACRRERASGACRRRRESAQRGGEAFLPEHPQQPHQDGREDAGRAVFVPPDAGSGDVRPARGAYH